MFASEPRKPRSPGTFNKVKAWRNRDRPRETLGSMARLSILVAQGSCTRTKRPTATGYWRGGTEQAVHYPRHPLVVERVGGVVARVVVRVPQGGGVADHHRRPAMSPVVALVAGVDHRVPRRVRRITITRPPLIADTPANRKPANVVIRIKKFTSGLVKAQ